MNHFVTNSTMNPIRDSAPKHHNKHEICFQTQTDSRTETPTNKQIIRDSKHRIFESIQTNLSVLLGVCDVG